MFKSPPIDQMDYLCCAPRCVLFVCVRFLVRAYCASIFLHKHAVDTFNECLFSLGDLGKKSACRFPHYGGGGGWGGGRTRANSVCFTKNLVKIGAFPNATPPNKIWKNLSVDQKDQRRRSVWVGHADFSKIAQRKQKFIKHVNCLFT